DLRRRGLRNRYRGCSSRGPPPRPNDQPRDQIVFGTGASLSRLIRNPPPPPKSKGSKRPLGRRFADGIQRGRGECGLPLQLLALFGLLVELIAQCLERLGAAEAECAPCLKYRLRLAESEAHRAVVFHID